MAVKSFLFPKSRALHWGDSEGSGDGESVGDTTGFDNADSWSSFDSGGSGDFSASFADAFSGDNTGTFAGDSNAAFQSAFDGGNAGVNFTDGSNAFANDFSGGFNDGGGAWSNVGNFDNFTGGGVDFMGGGNLFANDFAGGGGGYFSDSFNADPFAGMMQSSDLNVSSLGQSLWGDNQGGLYGPSYAQLADETRSVTDLPEILVTPPDNSISVVDPLSGGGEGQGIDPEAPGGAPGGTTPGAPMAFQGGAGGGQDAAGGGPGGGLIGGHSLGGGAGLQGVSGTGGSGVSPTGGREGGPTGGPSGGPYGTQGGTAFGPNSYSPSPGGPFGPGYTPGAQYTAQTPGEAPYYLPGTPLPGLGEGETPPGGLTGNMPNMFKGAEDPRGGKIFDPDFRSKMPVLDPDVFKLRREETPGSDPTVGLLAGGGGTGNAPNMSLPSIPSLGGLVTGRGGVGGGSHTATVPGFPGARATDGKISRFDAPPAVNQIPSQPPPSLMDLIKGAPNNLVSAAATLLNNLNPISAAQAAPAASRVGPFTAMPGDRGERQAQQSARDEQWFKSASPTDKYLSEVYNRTPQKVDRSGDFTWKDEAAASRYNKGTTEYAIGGLDRDFKTVLGAIGKAMDRAGIPWSISAAYRDNYRQSITEGYRASTVGSMHGGTSRLGGDPKNPISTYEKGQAADLTGVDRGDAKDAQNRAVWNFLDQHGSKFGVQRVIGGKDPPHVQPVGNFRQIAEAIRNGADPMTASAKAVASRDSRSAPNEAVRGQNLAREREAPVAELRGNPQLLDAFARMVWSEIGSKGNDRATLAQIESMLNASRANQISMADVLAGKHGPGGTKSGFFPGTPGRENTREAKSAAVNRANMPTEFAGKVGELLDRAARGSDEARGATGNASGSRGAGTITARIGGEKFGIEGYAQHKAWAGALNSPPTQVAAVPTPPARPPGAMEPQGAVPNLPGITAPAITAPPPQSAFRQEGATGSPGGMPGFLPPAPAAPEATSSPPGLPGQMPPPAPGRDGGSAPGLPGTMPVPVPGQDGGSPPGLPGAYAPAPPGASGSPAGQPGLLDFAQPTATGSPAGLPGWLQEAIAEASGSPPGLPGAMPPGPPGREGGSPSGLPGAFETFEGATGSPGGLPSGDRAAEPSAGATGSPPGLPGVLPSAPPGREGGSPAGLPGALPGRFNPAEGATGSPGGLPVDYSGYGPEDAATGSPAGLPGEYGPAEEATGSPGGLPGAEGDYQGYGQEGVPTSAMPTAPAQPRSEPLYTPMEQFGRNAQDIKSKFNLTDEAKKSGKDLIAGLTAKDKMDIVTGKQSIMSIIEREANKEYPLVPSSIITSKAREYVENNYPGGIRGLERDATFREMAQFGGNPAGLPGSEQEYAGMMPQAPAAPTAPAPGGSLPSWMMTPSAITTQPTSLADLYGYPGMTPASPNQSFTPGGGDFGGRGATGSWGEPQDLGPVTVEAPAPHQAFTPPAVQEAQQAAQSNPQAAQQIAQANPQAVQQVAQQLGVDILTAAMILALEERPRYVPPGDNGSGFGRWPQLPTPDVPGSFAGLGREIVRQNYEAQNPINSLASMMESGAMRFNPNSWDAMLAHAPYSNNIEDRRDQTMIGMR